MIENLNRHHINGLQFYDWLAAHHRPLAGSAERPVAEWPDLMNRPTYRLTTDNYLSEARSGRSGAPRRTAAGRCSAKSPSDRRAARSTSRSRG